MNQSEMLNKVDIEVINHVLYIQEKTIETLRDELEKAHIQAEHLHAKNERILKQLNLERKTENRRYDKLLSKYEAIEGATDGWAKRKREESELKKPQGLFRKIFRRREKE